MRDARRLRNGTCLMMLALSGSPEEAGAQSLALDSLFRAHRQPLELDERGPRGPGYDLLLEEAARAQFVMVGESHGVREIPLFTARLFEALHGRAGYQYLALENGPLAMEMFAASGVRGDYGAGVELANRYVNALQFRNDQEVRMISDAARASTARIDPVWGLDQTWGALHLVERLHALARSEEARSLAARLAADARPLESQRPADGRERFLTDRLTQADVEALRRAFGSDPEASRLVELLAISREIYASRRDRPSIYRSNDRRENFMRQQFMERYRAARASGDSLPRVVLKFGQWHAMKGVLNWGQVVPLGTFVSELARSNGMESLHVWTGLVNEPGHYWTLADYPDYAAIARAGSTDRWWVVDLRALRPLVAAGQVEGVNDEMHKVIFGFDVALLIGGGNPATHDDVR